MIQQTEQNLVERIDVLRLEIVSLEQELKVANQAKLDYCSELANDPAVFQRRLEQLATGFAAEHVKEFTDEQLAQVKQFMVAIRALENTIRNHYHTIQQIEKTIVEQQERAVATAAIEQPIREFNECLHKLRESWEKLEARAVEFEIEIPQQIFPGNAELYQQRGNPDYANYTPWLSIGFD